MDIQQRFADALVDILLQPYGIYLDDPSTIVIFDKKKFVKGLEKHIEEVK